MLFHALQPLGKQFLLPVEKGFGSRGRGAYRLPYNIGMPHVILHRYNDQTDPHYTEQTKAIDQERNSDSELRSSASC